jgi:hypothetical protein
MFNRIGRALQGALDPDKIGQVKERQPTIESLLPGDVVSLWEEGDLVVESVLECSESVNNRDTGWRWNVLDEGRMLETAPDGNVVYSRTRVLRQDSAEFETLTSDPEVGGVLKSFETRVQQGTAARNPSLFEVDGKVYRVVSTGTFAAKLSLHSSLPRTEVWRDVDMNRPVENVYFELTPTELNEDDPERIVLGIWTTHIALLFGRDLLDGVVQSIYPRLDEEPKRP